MKSKTGKSNLDMVRDYLSGTRPFITSGWTPDLIERKEGEQWVDAQGKSWIFKNGQRKRINKTTFISDLIKQKCKCGQEIRFGNRLDRKMFNKTGMCFDCLIEFESKLKAEGKYADYEKRKIASNQLSFYKDMKSKLEESIRFLEDNSSKDKLQFFNEDGSQEFWPDTMREKLLEGAKKDYKTVLETIEKLEKEIKTIPDYAAE